MEEKNELDALREKLLYKQKQGYDIIDVDERIKLEEYATAYKAYLNAARTEREAVTEAIAQAEALGFVPYERGMVLEPGTKIYKSVRGKALMLAVMGRETLDHGANIAAAHVDSPRLDLKPIPLYEKDEICLLKTHYYGGIKKYQWVAIPLEIHGVVTKKDGETIEVVIGKDPEDPKFTITDLLPHLAKDQMAKHGSDIIPGEYLNLLAGSVPYAGEGTKRVMLAVMSLLNDRYGITEEDFLSAELEVVPSFEACDIGVDRSFIGGYGQDDRVCAYAELKAIFDTETPDRTAVCVLADKEEIGSMGVSGMQSRAFETFMADLCEQQDVHLRDCFENSFCGQRGRLQRLRPDVLGRERVPQPQRRPRQLRRRHLQVHRLARQVRQQRCLRRGRRQAAQDLCRQRRCLADERARQGRSGRRRNGRAVYGQPQHRYH